MQQAIICVDDERSILTALQQQIMRAFSDNYWLEFAESGEEALEIINDFASQNIQLAAIITDEMMPGMKGHELIVHVSTVSPNTPCILLTGYAQHEVMNQIMSSNLAHCLSKPWDSQELLGLINESIRKQAAIAH
jgi:YesN/AraC family two-component response regulator